MAEVEASHVGRSTVRGRAITMPTEVEANPQWHAMQSVDRREEEEAYEHLHHAVRTPWQNTWFELQGWVLVIMLGIASSLSGAFVEKGVEYCSSLRRGWCTSRWFSVQDKCNYTDWISWGYGVEGFVMSVGLGVAFAFVSAFMVKNFAPCASGSGVPETKTILNGFVLPDAVSLRTLIVKGPGLVLSVSAGMALGKEGPMVHLAMCWAQLLSQLFPQYRNEAKRRELFSAAAAAGVSTAFGAPIGGVLFSLEEVSTFFPTLTLTRAFTAAVAAATALQVMNLTGTGHLTMFSVSYNTSFNNLELPVFALLGVIGGCVGAAFNDLNVRWATVRLSAQYTKRIGPIMEVSFLALVTTASSWWLDLTRPLSSEVIHGLFQDCSLGDGYDIRKRLNLCDQTQEGVYVVSTALMTTLAGAAFIRFWLQVFTFGTKCPAGLFVPSLYAGACIGRLVGVAIHAANAHHGLFDLEVQPGIYAMIGAASVLAGVCRVTISLVVIMLELTGSTTYTVPFMLSILIAKLTGDKFNEGIYDLYIVLKGYPFMHEEVHTSYTEHCNDIMETTLHSIHTNLAPSIHALKALCRTYCFHGYPVVDGHTFVGYIRRTCLEQIIDELSAVRGEEGKVTLDDLLPKTDRTVIRLIPDTSLVEAHKVFAQLGASHIFIVGHVANSRYDTLQGIITKKNFLSHVQKSQSNKLLARITRNGPSAAASDDGTGGGSGALQITQATARRASTMARIHQSQLRRASNFGALMELNVNNNASERASRRMRRAALNSGSFEEGQSSDEDESERSGSPMGSRPTSHTSA